MDDATARHGLELLRADRMLLSPPLGRQPPGSELNEAGLTPNGTHFVIHSVPLKVSAIGLPPRRPAQMSASLQSDCVSPAKAAGRGVFVLKSCFDQKTLATFVLTRNRPCAKCRRPAESVEH